MVRVWALCTELCRALCGGTMLVLCGVTVWEHRMRHFVGALC